MDEFDYNLVQVSKIKTGDRTVLGQVYNTFPVEGGRTAIVTNKGTFVRRTNSVMYRAKRLVAA